MDDIIYFVGTMNDRPILCLKENKELTEISRPLTREEIEQIAIKLNTKPLTKDK